MWYITASRLAGLIPSNNHVRPVVCLIIREFNMHVTYPFTDVARLRRPVEQTEAINRLIKTGGLLEDRAAYDVLLNDKLPKMLLVFSIKRAGIIKPMLSHRLSEVVHEAAALLARDGAIIIYKPGGGRMFSHAYVVSKRTGLITGKPSTYPLAPHKWLRKPSPTSSLQPPYRALPNAAYACNCHVRLLLS